jgi:hypothetical protein
MAVVRRHALALLERGWDCALVVTGGGAVPASDAGIPVRSLSSLGPVHVAIATWWTTADALFELDAARRVMFLQNLEARFYGADELADRLGAAGVLDLPVDFLVIASHMVELLRDLRPDARVKLVPNGIDKTVFTPAGGARLRGGELGAPARDSAGAPRDLAAPLRVLVEGQPTLWFKAVPEAVAAVRAMGEPATVTVAVHDPADAGSLGADRVVGGLSPEQMAALYREHDVLLKLSRFEGFSLPPMEAFHCGVPCVITPFTGSEAWARHGGNALVVGFDDEPGTAAALDRLSRDRELLARLSAGALETAERWPDQASTCARFAGALEELLDEPPPSPEAALRRLARSRRQWIELTRSAAESAAIELREALGEAAWWKDAAGKWEGLADDRLASIHDLTSRPSYRAAHLAKRLTGRGE